MGSPVASSKAADRSSAPGRALRPGGGRGQFRAGGAQGRPPVDLAARGARQRGQHPEAADPYVRREQGREVLGERTGRGRPGAAFETGGQGAVLQSDGRVHHVGVAQQRRFHLAEFEPVAAELDLLVLPAVVVKEPVRGEGGPVTAAVEESLAGEFDEAFLVEGRVAEVAAGGHVAADQQVADAAGRQRLVSRVHDAQPRTGHRGADGRAFRPERRVALQAQGADHVGLGGPVVVEKAGAGQSGEPAADRVGAHQLLARGDHLAQPGGVAAEVDGVFGEQLEGHVRHEDALHARRFHPVEQRRDVVPPLGAHEVQAAAAAQRGEDLLERHVEGQHGELLGDGGPGEAALGRLPVEQVGQGAVVDLDALGDPGGAGGEECVQRSPGVRGRGCGLGLRQGDGAAYRSSGVHRVEGGPAARCEEHAHGGDLAQDLPQRFRRVGRVEGHGGPVEAGEGQQGDHVFHRGFQEQGHVPLLRLRPVRLFGCPFELLGRGAEFLGEGGRPACEARVGDVPVPGPQGGGVGGAGGLGREALGHGGPAGAGAPPRPRAGSARR